MTYVSIAAGIVAKLGTVTELEQVYNHEPKELAKFPCATVTAFSHTDVFADTAANTRQFTFMIRLYFRTDTAQDAETVLRNVADKVIAKIESDVTLNGSCDFARPSEGRWLFQQREVPVRVVEITIEALKRLNR